MVIVVSLDIALEAFGVGANDKIFDKVVGGVVVVAVTVVANESIFGKVVVGAIVAAVVVVVIVVAYDKIFARVEDGTAVGVVLDAFAYQRLPVARGPVRPHGGRSNERQASTKMIFMVILCHPLIKIFQNPNLF